MDISIAREFALALPDRAHFSCSHSASGVASSEAAFTVLFVCSGQTFEEAQGKIMSQHVSSDKRKEKAAAAWGTAESLDSIKEAFTAAVSDEATLFPWAEAGLPKATRALAPQWQQMVQQGMLPINVLPTVRCKILLHGASCSRQVSYATLPWQNIPPPQLKHEDCVCPLCAKQCRCAHMHASRMHCTLIHAAH